MTEKTEDIEKKILRIIEKNKDRIQRFAEDIQAHPEPGFSEHRTASCVSSFFKEAGFFTEEKLAETGVRGSLPKKEGPHITVIGEMDAIGCSSHPMADPENRTAHACGHHAQLAVMMGAAIALSDPEIQRSLGGSVSFLAVPAEEYIDAEKRKRLREKGMGFPASGKSELIRQGAFDHTDIVLTTHVHMVPVKEDFYLGNPACNGYCAEKVTIKGKSSHAAIAPWDGVNALSIATSAISMMGMMRETFREEDHVRLHNVIRKGGEVINNVPEEAVIETKVRAASLERIGEIQEMVNRAYEGAAYAFGGSVEKELLQGYMPVRFREADPVMEKAARILGRSVRRVSPSDFNNACTDVGDMTQLFPVLNFTFGGFEGDLHSPDFRITDPELAYVDSGKLLALTIYGLLRNGGEEAKKIIRDFTPVFDKESYCAYIKEHYQI